MRNFQRTPALMMKRREMKFNEFLECIRSIKLEAGRYRVIFLSHTLDVRYGYDEYAYPSLFIKLDEEFDLQQIPSTHCIKILNKKYQDGEINLTFSVVEQDKEELFIRLCYDILEASKGEQSKAEALKVLIKRFLNWRKLFDGTSKKELSKEKIQGLCGELLYFLYLLDSKAPKDVVAAWRGPCQADQDFMFDSIWIEVKTIKFAATKVKISSLEQLAVTMDGILALYKLEDADALLEKSITLFLLVKKIESKLSNAPSSLLAFYEKLLQLNVDIEMPIYKTTAFELKEFTRYDVKEGFPRLTPELRKHGIVSAEYAISLESIDVFRKDV